MPRIRCFVAVETPSEVLQRIAALIADLQSVSSDVKWEHTEKLHITVKFLGTMNESDVHVLIRVLKEKIRMFSRFDYKYEGIGAFPDLERPRVYWIGTSKNHSLVQLHTSVEEVTQSLSVANDDRPFHPHVTIGRVKDLRGINLLTARVKTLTFEPVDARCSDVLIMKSDLHPTGSRYSILSRIPLNL
ncbi:MAG TPA: RNA 2',3'-cyclic phosphodiesterase [Bacteroidota bacterium]|nr:RNA 2',3'-cyclic phosphodiesterase [Bacteroidota bacterium]